MTEQSHGEPQDNTLEALVRRLTALVVKIDERDDHLMDLIEEQREFNRQQVEINREVHTTLARVETLLSRMIPQSGNGTEA